MVIDNDSDTKLFSIKRSSSFESAGCSSSCDSDYYSGSSSYTSSDEDEESNTENSQEATPQEAEETADANAGLFLNLESVKQLRKSSSEGNFSFDIKKWLPPSLIDKMTPRRCSGGRPTASRMVYAIQTKSALESTTYSKEKEGSVLKPKETLVKVLSEEGIQVDYRKSTDIPDFFVPCCVTSHSLDLMNAIRQNDVSTVRSHHNAGKSLQCGNKFGETIVHAAARRGNTEVLKFMVEIAGVSVRVCCDGGRTPLHDACWTGHPDFGTIRFLLEQCPDFLLLQDKRNFTPLDFIPKEAHPVWNDFLKANRDLIKPQGLF